MSIRATLVRRRYMSKLILKMSMSLDGFVGGANGEMDWVLPSRSPEGTAWVIDQISRADVHAMGRASWVGWSTFYPTATIPFAPAMNAIPKLVFTCGDMAEGDGSWAAPRVARDLAAIKQHGTVVAHGGASFARALVEADLVDEYALVIHPVVLGRGLPLFSVKRDLELVSSTAFPKGAVGSIYRRMAETIG